MKDFYILISNIYFFYVEKNMKRKKKIKVKNQD